MGQVWGVLSRLRRPLRIALLAALTFAATAASASAATIKVNTTNDEVTSGDHLCSLREAIAAIDAPGTSTDCGTADALSNIIVLGPKTYQLSIKRIPLSDDNSNGDLNINVAKAGPVEIAGRGPGTTNIVGQPALDDRLLSISQSSTVSLVGMSLKGGHAPSGTGLVSCTAGQNGGAIDNAGQLSTDVIEFSGNTAGNGGAGGSGIANGCSGGDGGAIYNESTGSLRLAETTFDGSNGAGNGGAGAPATASVIAGNGGAGGYGGGVYYAGGNVNGTSSTFASNQAGNGGAGGAGDSGSGGNGGNGGDGGFGGAIASAGGSLVVTNVTAPANTAGNGGVGGDSAGSGTGGNGGNGGNGGAVAVLNGTSSALNSTMASNGAGDGGNGGNSGGSGGSGGLGSSVYVDSSSTANDMTLQNSIVVGSSLPNCAGNTTSAIKDGGHNLDYPDTSCPETVNANPNLMPLALYGGSVPTLALSPGSPAINQIPKKGAGCPATDARGVRRPQGSACDIGAYEFAVPRIRLHAPKDGAKYKRGSKVLASYSCSEGGIASPIATCTGTVANGQRINTSKLGKHSFTVTATDKAGNTTTKTVRYTVIR